MSETIPEAELARRRRVLQLADELVPMLNDSLPKLSEMRELGLKLEEVFDVIARAEGIDPMIRSAVDEFLRHFESAASASADPEPGVKEQPPLRGDLPIALVLDRLFLESPPLRKPDGSVDETQAPAIVCHILLRGQGQPLYGALSMTPEGALRMLTPTNVDHHGEARRKVLLEQFFDVDDVAAIMVERPVEVNTGPRIITPS